jgi:hypothetical protein
MHKFQLPRNARNARNVICAMIEDDEVGGLKVGFNGIRD